MKLIKRFLLASIAFIAVSCAPLNNGQFSLDSNNSGDNTQQGQGGNDTPIEDNPVTPVEDDPVTPVEDDPVTPVEDDPVTPVEDDPVTPIEDDPVTPVDPTPVDPTPVEPATISVESVSLNFTNYTLKVRDTLQLKASVYPLNATNKAVSFKRASGRSFINLSEGGLVTAVKPGKAIVRVVTEDGSKTATCTISVLETYIPVESVSLSETSVSVKQGQTVSVSATVLPADAQNKNVTWSSSDTSVATVSNGVITGKKAGSSATITATTEDLGLTASCVVTVTEPVHATSVSLNENKHTVSEGSSFTLTPTVLPSDAYDKSVTWTSSNTSVATVSNGTVKGVKAGTSTITAKTVDGGLTASCVVTVEESKGAAWTVMLYICGADLESANGLATSDIKEILSVSNQPDDVNIIMETGGASSWKSTYGISASKLERWHVANKKLVKDASLSDASMGASSTLQSFLEWGLTTYPAEKTALILWNHGGGMGGVCFDENHYNDSLLSKEVISAVKGAFKSTGRSSSDKLEWIGYDACLMQVQDIAEMNSAYFNYMVGSEETESGYGWDYDNWVDDLYAKKSTENILKAIVDSFIKENGSSSDQTLSYLNLSYAEEFKTAWEDMAGALKSKITSSNKSSFASLAKSAKEYAKGYGFGLYDAKDFVNKLTSNSTFKLDSQYTTAVLNAHSNFVGYSSAGSGAGKSYGLCYYFGGTDSYIAGTDTNFTNWAYLSNTYGKSGSSSGWY